MAKPRNGSPLTIDVHRVGSRNPRFEQIVADDSGPGEIYPSVVDVPSPGCWEFNLSWAGNHAALDLAYA